MKFWQNKKGENKKRKINLLQGKKGGREKYKPKTLDCLEDFKEHERALNKIVPQ